MSKKINLSNVKAIRPWKNGVMLVKVTGETEFVSEKDCPATEIYEKAEQKGFALVVNRYINLNLVEGVNKNIEPANDKYDMIISFEEGNNEIFNCKSENNAQYLVETIRGIVSSYQNRNKGLTK